LIFGFLAVEEQEWVNKQREVNDEGDIEGAIFLDRFLWNAKDIVEIELFHLGQVSG